ncbi:MAG TPA: tetratricopeptide repeat protein [Kofleriaceae bacterium]|nr:tetratricopeptide repeat protein [Kofleriaceae bacterium]
MLFEHRYSGSSAVRQDQDATGMSFAPDTLREPTYFRGKLTRQIEFREAISALHDVVTSDLRFIPKDRTAYLQWREQQSYIDLAAVSSRQVQLAADITKAQQELSALEHAASHRRSGFYKARQKYFDYLYNRDREMWFKLDPVITVHPDQVFFECFSKDESSYGRLAASYNVFEELGERANGTTNIDYSEKLYGEFQKIRSYKTTTLDVDPGGFNVKTSMEEQYREVKIDLPDSWVRGFLQVSSAATLPGNVVELHPMDVYNLCHVLRRNKELFGPRSLRFKLTPGAPVEIVVEPWNHVVKCPRSRQTDGTATEIRVWGRRRLFILERLLPRAKRVRVFLLGTGLPTFWVVDLGELSFTLGLSGWTQNNWSEAGNFDLMAAREEVDNITQQRVFNELGKVWLATPEELAKTTGLATPVVASALAGWVQAGRAIFDLDRGVYRKRELTREPLPMDKLRFANEREESAAQMLHRAKIAVDKADTSDGGLALAGRIHDYSKLYGVALTFDADRRLVQGECSCDFFIRNRLHRGPCEHMLALRAAHRRGVNDVITFTPQQTTSRGAVPQQSTQQLRQSFQDAYRRSVARAAELRQQGRAQDAIAELERVLRIAPPNSDEEGRLNEVIAEARFDAGDHQAAQQAADRALTRFPTSILALRIKRDAFVELDDIEQAIPVARALAHIDNKPERWDELCTLCDSIADHRAMFQFAEEGLRLHKGHPKLTQHRERARGNLPPGSVPPAPAAPPTPDAAKPSWWRRAVGAITGKPPTTPPPTLDGRLDRIMGELAQGSTIRDREAVLQLLRVAHAAADRDDARVFALAAALKDTPFISNLPDDQELLALLRRALS